MLFNSYLFLLFFLPASLAIFYVSTLFRRDIIPVVVLAAASIVFYCVWQVSYLHILVGSIFWNFLLGRLICILRGQFKDRLARATLALGVTGDLLLLGYYKYSAFAIQNLQDMIGFKLDTWRIVLPLGISFFTFTQIAYIVDAYRGKVSDHSFSKYLLFVTYFPHLIAGPILHHKDMISQFNWPKRDGLEISRNIYLGIVIFVLGLTKKIAIADPLAHFANVGYANAGALNVVDGWIASLSYTFQLYFDFSAYSDMAVGLGLMMQVRLPINFNVPYVAHSIQDFWRRWHITLSNFLRDYLYIPLGGNRKGELVTLRNLFLTFLLGGLWHGAGWTFIIWGALHGAALVVYRCWNRAGLSLPRWAGVLATFLFVNLAWVYFRADSIQQAHSVLRAMFGMHSLGEGSRLFTVSQLVDQFRVLEQIPFVSTHMFAVAACIVSSILAVYFTVQNVHATALRIRPGIVAATGCAILVCFALLKLDRSVQFLYFNF
jgi:alginate O-acetyltransferase complex protein AlgI